MTRRRTLIVTALVAAIVAVAASFLGSGSAQAASGVDITVVGDSAHVQGTSPLDGRIDITVDGITVVDGVYAYEGEPFSFVVPIVDCDGDGWSEVIVWLAPSAGPDDTATPVQPGALAGSRFQLTH